MTSSFVLPTVASCVDLVVHLAQDPEGRRRVQEIVAVPGRVEGDVLETAEVFGLRDGRLERSTGFPPHPERFRRIGVDLARLLDADQPVRGVA
ncbi:hypothetical protein GCM10025868_12210 [Angustibacter aerolatus]|uniref:Uncharacterized protein n=1 Tax=Angustibacter aerolatus TaxID=1162965 RepID=A0ABQ6JGS4_9ACTN|nr:hypothetical protein GCM10025868_12210 [Angustibacter aerolatus]